MKNITLLCLLSSFSLICLSCKEHGAIATTEEQRSTTSKSVKTTESFNPTYAHVVYFWFKEPDNTEDRALFERSLRTFLNNSAYAKTQFIGTPPVATREVVDDSFTYSLIVSFESAQAQRAYQDEAPHKKFISECAHLWERVIVYDANTVK